MIDRLTRILFAMIMLGMTLVIFTAQSALARQVQHKVNEDQAYVSADGLLKVGVVDVQNFTGGTARISINGQQHIVAQAGALSAEVFGYSIGVKSIDNASRAVTFEIKHTPVPDVTVTKGVSSDLKRYGNPHPATVTIEVLRAGAKQRTTVRVDESTYDYVLPGDEIQKRGLRLIVVRIDTNLVTFRVIVTPIGIR